MVYTIWRSKILTLARSVEVDCRSLVSALAEAVELFELAGAKRGMREQLLADATVFSQAAQLAGRLVARYQR